MAFPDSGLKGRRRFPRVGVENRSRVWRDRRKENVPPRFSSHLMSEPRNVQKNVNINLYLDPGSHADASRSAGAAFSVSNQSEAVAQARPREGNGVTRPQNLVQTNLSCAYWPIHNTASGFSNSSSRQQSNLESRLQRCGSESVVRVGHPRPRTATDRGPSRSCPDKVGLKTNPPNDFSDRSRCWSRKPTEGFEPCSRCDVPERRMEIKDQCALKPPLGCVSVSKRSCGNLRAHGDSSPLTQLSVIASEGSLSPDASPSKRANLSASGPALTLEQLNSSTLIEIDPSSAVLQALLRSSRTSAKLHGSIQRLKEEAATMGALGSSPWETKSPPFSCRPRLDPRVSTSAVLGLIEESSAKQASAKWRTPFAKGWGLGPAAGALRDAEPLPFGYRAKNAQFYERPTETLGQCWPTPFYGGAGSTTLAFRAEESYPIPNPPGCYLGCCSGVQKVPEGKGTRDPLNSLYHPRALDPEELSSRPFRRSELAHENLPPFDGLELSLETLCAGTPVNMGVAVYGPQREVLLTMGSPRDSRFILAHRFGVVSEDPEVRGPQGEPGGAYGGPVTTYSADDSAPFPPHKSCPFGVVGRKGLREYSRAAAGTTDGIDPTGVGESSSSSQNSLCVDIWPGAKADQSKASFTEKTAKLPHLEERRRVMGGGPEEELEPEDRSTDGNGKRPLLLLGKCFRVWHRHVSEKAAAARALYRRQLLRKGLSALKWAVQLGDDRLGVGQRGHARAVLAASFRRWRDAAAKQQREATSQREAEAQTTDSPALLERERITKRPFFCQLSAEHLKEAAQYSRAEGNLWIQHHLTQGEDQLGQKIQAVRDVRRLAAFRLWRLQKERLDKEEASVREVRAILEKRRLRGLFERWRSRSCANRRILPLVAQMQRRLVGRCFSAWKGFAGREARGRRGLEIQRLRSLRLPFLQWALMAAFRERARRTVSELFTRRQRTFCARFDLAADAPVTQPCPIVARWSQRNGADALEGLYHALRLQAAFWTWRARWRDHEQANAFRHAVAQRQQREALECWRQKALRANSLGPCSKDLAEEPVLPLLVSEESSLSSGFHSQAPTLPVSGSFLGKEKNSLSGSSWSSISSLEDSGILPQHDRPSPWCDPDPDVCIDTTVAFCDPARPRGICCAGEDHVVRDHFQPLGSFSPDCGAPSFAVSSAWEGARSGGNRAENQRQLLERCFAIWAAHTRQTLKAELHHRRALQSWALISWSVATAHASIRHKALVHFEAIRLWRLLASCFEKWKAEFLRAEWQRKEDHLCHKPVRRGALQRWRKMARSYRALRLNSVKEACSYWTQASAFRQCRRQWSSLVGARKFAKLPLAWANKPSREKQRHSRVAVGSRLTQSSFCTWQMIYRCQSTMLGSPPWPSPGSLDAAVRKGEEDRILGSDTEVAPAVGDRRRHLGRKYLGLWRHNVLLRRFRNACRIRLLARAWLSWKDACRTELVVKTLVRQRLVEWSWKTWRQRCLRSWVAERFLEAQYRRLLVEAFRQWRQLAASCAEGSADF
ncbi:uncharacterized protein C1orf167 homolog isoform X2 [Hemicordylus capensis]|uniref:uncharacterized protein C1orf167 homolog isoform X2 n=1 Tax=Hemicordylus capensis TaxID=884348 RepID=UPI00230462E1|nr:uncharacterized protein C1orf167 homolog isoform X2 [Hemicordylus capensis]